MAGGYELVYRRLAALPEVRERWTCAARAVEEARLTRHAFRLVLSDDAPPGVRVEWTVEACLPGGTAAGTYRPDQWFQLWDVIRERIMPASFLRGVAEANRETVRRTYPCQTQVAEEGRGVGDKGGHQMSFAAWALDAFKARHQERMDRRTQEIKDEARARESSPAFKEEARRALEDLAVEDLASKMVLYARVPNVIKRASELFVVKDVMEG
jgi:hypothetical protein